MLKVQKKDTLVEKQMSVKTHVLNETHALFECTMTITKDGNVQKTKVTSGIQSLNVIDSQLKDGNVIEPNHSFIILNDELKEALRTLGFPNYGEHDVLTNGETKETFEPYNIFIKLIEEQVVTFDKIESNPDLIDSIVYFDYANYRVNYVKTNKSVNTAVFTQWLHLENSHVKNYPDVIQGLFEQGRLIAQLNSRNELLRWYTGSGYDVSGRVVFTDAEYDALVERESFIRQNIENLPKYANYFFNYVGQAFMELDLLGVSDNYYGKETNNVFETKPEDNEDEY